MASQNSSQSTTSKRQRLMTESYELDRVEGLDLNEFNDRLDQRNEISTPVDINNDSEWKEFDNGDTEYDSDFDCSSYERLEEQNVTDINGIKHNECNFSEVVDHDDSYLSLDEFVIGVSTNENLTKKNYLTDMINTSKIHIKEKRLSYIKKLYNKHNDLGLFYCFLYVRSS